MPLNPGTRLGSFEIVSLLGAGGMGEVYKARDTRLDRLVAVKVSKEEFTERFEREARVVSSLQHPHICHLYDVGPNYLVMEYVEGTPLKGPLPVAKALEYACQIASALDVAHSHYVTHRDLKPANILVTRTGGVKLLDFGLAKIDNPVTSTGTSTTALLTGEGTIVGTWLYMSPEQINCGDVGPRSDIFSFGLVLYEMVTGKRAFDGTTPASVIAAILERPTPSIADVGPQALDRILKRCLEKDPDDRWQSARDLRGALELVTPTSDHTVSAAPDVARSHVRRWIWPVVALVSASAAVMLALVHFGEPRPPELHTIRFEIPPPENTTVDYFKLSPDGRMLALVAGRRLWIQPLDSLHAQRLPGTEGVEQVFWSPDSQFLAFIAQGKLKKMMPAGGPAQIVCSVAQAHGGTWNRDGMIVLPLSLTSGLFQVPASGGTPVPLAKGASTTAQELMPEFLPDGRHFLYMELKHETAGIHVGSLDGGPTVRILPDLSPASYVPAVGRPGTDGYLLFRRSGTVMAQRFNPWRLSISGEAFPVAENAGGTVLWSAFSTSETGALVIAPASGGSVVQLSWWDRHGKLLGPFGPPGTYQNFRLAPDQSHIAFAENGDIWVLDSVRGVRSRLTFDPGIDDPPMWSPDGSRIVWASNRGGPFDLYVKPANGAGPERALVRMGTAAGWPEDWTSDGHFILYQIPGATTGQDLWIAPQLSEGTSDERKPFPYLQTQFDEKHGRFSPDGRWVTYTSNESGVDEVYVQSFPLSGAKFQISAGGGSEPQWRRDGSEVFFIGPDRMLMAAPITFPHTTSEPLQIGQPKPLIPVPLIDTFIVGRSYEVSNDGQRFLMWALPPGVTAPTLTAVLNWQAQFNK